MSRAFTAALAALLLLPAAATGSPGSGPTAVVTLGDSYSSGEAGRWQGNSASLVPDYDGTDRGAAAYLDTTGCHRSDVAEVLSADLPVAERVNLACSGARTDDLFRSSQGGQVQHGEPPQGDQLLPVAREKDVQMVLVSIGGNDLGFANIVSACLLAYEQRSGPCEASQQQRIDDRLAEAAAGVRKSIDEVRAVMRQAGYLTRDYRLVLQTYPSVVPRAAEARYAEADPRRTSAGCPFYDSDLDWARDEASKQIGTMVKRAAAARGAEWLEVHDLLQGHEICARTAQAHTPIRRPAPRDAEWGRALSPSTIAQAGGSVQELFHPNALAQQALGACLTGLHAARRPGRFSCAGGAGIEPGGVTFRRLGSVRIPLRLRVLRTFARGAQRCVLVQVRGAGAPVRGATVRYAGGRARTSRAGRATVCGSGRGATATATKRGFARAGRAVRPR